MSTLVATMSHELTGRRADLGRLETATILQFRLYCINFTLYDGPNRIKPPRFKWKTLLSEYIQKRREVAHLRRV